MRRTVTLITVFSVMPFLGAQAWEEAHANAERNRLSMLACWRYSQAWLQFADAESGLIPRNLNRDLYWNAKDAAADNYPFLVLTAFFTDKALYEGRMKAMLAAEQRLCNRVDRLPDDYVFATRRFRVEEPKIADLIFGASEYVKDGLLPMTEWIGPSPWADRMLGLLDDVWKHAAIETEVGVLPSTSHEVAGELMQSLSRMYWMTGKESYMRQSLRLAAYYLEHHLPTETERLSLDDHGCEVIGGISEVYYLAMHKAPEKREQWREAMHRMLGRVLEIGCDEKGMFYMHINPSDGQVLNEERTDNWGYNYNAFATVAKMDGVVQYDEAIRRVLGNLGEYMDYPWEGGRPDGLADSLEGGLNLLNRYPVPEAAVWADHTADRLLGWPRDTGIFEGWHGDGNAARTLIMYALWKSQGTWAEPWRADVGVGACLDAKGALLIEVKADWPYEGILRFDVPRHRVQMGIPEDYARLNQFPEWFTAKADTTYEVAQEGRETTETNTGTELAAGIPIRIGEGKAVRIRVTAK